VYGPAALERHATGIWSGCIGPPGRVRTFAASRPGRRGGEQAERYRQRVAGPAARYDRIADFYDARAGRAVTDPATAALLDLAGDVRGRRLLDVACGPGRVARELARRGARVTGLDISAALLAKARAYEEREPLGVTYVQGDATAGRVLEGQVFDGATCNYGLSDIDDLDGLLATVARLVTAGGWLVFSLLHPCFPGWDRDAPSSWPPDLGYFREGWWLASNPGFRGKVGSSHRMLSTYLNSLTGHGFVPEQVAEPPPAPPGNSACPARRRCRSTSLPGTGGDSRCLAPSGGAWRDATHP
jgi:SAM-dependent methyltransferase